MALYKYVHDYDMMYIIVTGRCLATAADAARSCDFRSVLYEARGSFT